MAIKKPTPLQELMFKYVEAVNNKNTRLANKLVKEIDAMKAGIQPAEKASKTPKKAGVRPAKKTGVASKAGKVSVKKSDTAKGVSEESKPIKIPSRRTSVAKPRISKSEESYMAPTRPVNSPAPVNGGPAKNRAAQWRNVGDRPFINKWTDPGTDDLPPKHKKLDRKLAKKKREAELRDPTVMVETTCFICHQPVLAYPADLERYSDDEKVTKTGKVRCNSCCSTK